MTPVSFHLNSSQESDELSRSLSLYVRVSRGEINRALSLLPFKDPSFGHSKDWKLLRGAISQLISVHTVDQVDGVSHILIGTHHDGISAAKSLMGKLKTTMELKLEGFDSYVLMNSLGLLADLRVGYIGSMFLALPFDFNQNYNFLGFKDWYITQRVVSSLLSPYLEVQSLTNSLHGHADHELLSRLRDLVLPS